MRKYFFIFLILALVFLFESFQMGDRKSVELRSPFRSSSTRNQVDPQEKKHSDDNKIQVVPATASQKFEKDIFPLLESLSQRQFEVGTIDSQREEELQKTVATWTEEEWMGLAHLLLRKDSSPAIKRSISYLLSLAKSEAIPALIHILQTPSAEPRLRGEHSDSSEDTYRIGALEDLDLLAIHSSSAQDALKKIQPHEVAEDLRFFLSIAQSGLQQNRPGKLHRLLSTTLSQM